MKKLQKNKIAILSTVINFELYEKSLRTHPKGIDRYVIDGRQGMHGIHSITYMFSKLKKMNYDWIIMADEDVFFINPEGVFNLIKKMDVEDISVAGLRDGGELNHRLYNPFVMNTFFLILNIKKIRPLWNKSEMLKTKLDNSLFDGSTLERLNYDYDVNSWYEPYYCFFYWLAKKDLKFLYLSNLNPINDNDSISNLVYDDEGNDLLVHTWYARAYKKNKEQTDRINDIVKTATFYNENDTFTVWFKKSFKYDKMLKKIIRRIIGKMKAITKSNS
ncbi:MAG: hypothetical protein JXQ93_09990 [Flavobacteriaceae bacterium]